MPPINDVRVRKALNMAIDREAFIGTLLPEARCWPPRCSRRRRWSWNKDVPVWKYDPESAKKLLEEARGRRRSGR